MQVLAPEPQAAIHSESNFCQAALHIGQAADEVSPIKGQAIESDSEIEQVGPVGRNLCPGLQREELKMAMKHLQRYNLCVYF